MSHQELTPQFVEHVPRDLQDGVLYISITYRTAVHKCACGCGRKVVTPIAPAHWQLIYDGDTVTLTPSVGNWQFPCRSHYWIKHNEIHWAPQWTDQQIAAGRERDRRALDFYYDPPEHASATAEQSPPAKPVGFWRRLLSCARLPP